MDALKSISTNVPDWLKRLDDLSGQIVQRQAELAALDSKTHSSARSMRNRGSTESLKPKDESPGLGPSPALSDSPADDAPKVLDFAVPAPSNAGPPPAGQADDKPEDVSTPASPGGGTPAAINRQSRQAMAVVQSRAQAQVRRKERSASVASINMEGKPPTYRTRSMIIIYYDSYVQSFFEELVKFVSASRGLLRKAKMAAKVAHIRRMADVDGGPSDDATGGGSSGGGGGGGDEADSALPLPSMLYNRVRQTRQQRSGAGQGVFGEQKSDVYTTLDEHLEQIQTTCEKTAHQFLRDGDCGSDIVAIQKRFQTTLELSHKEMERIEREEPDSAKDLVDAGKARTLRPAAMRRELTGQSKKSEPSQPSPSAVPADKASSKGSAKGERPLLADAAMEVDEDEGVDDAEWEPPKLEFRRAGRGGF